MIGSPVGYSQFEAARCLVERGARTKLWHAAAQYLLARGANLNWIPEWSRQTPLDISQVSNPARPPVDNLVRWLLVVWIAYHVILSAFHSLTEVAIHSLLFGVIAYFLFRPQASAYFRRQSLEHPQIPELGER